MADRQKRGIKPYDGDLKKSGGGQATRGETHPGRLPAQGGLNIGQLMASLVGLIEGLTVIGTGAGDKTLHLTSSGFGP